MATGEGPHILEWIKSNRKEKKILRLKDKAGNFASLHPLQSEISQGCKFSKAHVNTKNLKREDETWPRRECHK
jgi:hypothetical protein